MLTMLDKILLLQMQTGVPPIISSGAIADLTAGQQAQITTGTIVTTTDGYRWQYTGTGSKVLEAASGEALPALAQRHLFGPLGCRNTTMPDGGGSAFSTADDLVRVGQMLLNKGAYGDMRFMSEQTFAQLLPARLTKVLGPGNAQVYGLGTMWLDGEGWGKGTFAHPAKSETVLRIDPEHDLVVAIARSRRGTNFETYYPRFIQAVLSGIVGGNK